MFDANKVLGSLLGGQEGKAAAKGAFGGSMAGGLAGTVLGNVLTGKGGKKLGKRAMQMGGLAVVGGVAYAAWKHYNNRDGSGRPQPANAEEALTPPPADSGYLPPTAYSSSGTMAQPAAQLPAPDPHQNDLSLLLLRAMISAAKADGQIDSDEQRRIFERLGEAELDAEARAFLFDELGKPLDLEALVRGVERPEVAAEVYAASLLAIEVDSLAERGYLQMLSGRLGLEDGLAKQIEAEVAAVKAAG